MSSITIQQLPQAPLPLVSSDAIIVSRGTNQEYKATMLNVWTISTSVFPSSSSILATDQMMIWRNGSPYIVSFSDVGFIAGTSMWFYSASAPAGWQIIAMAGDVMLGVVNSNGASVGNSFVTGGSILLNSTTGVGSWKMLSTQLPPHEHYVQRNSDNTDPFPPFPPLPTGGGLLYTNKSSGSEQANRYPTVGVVLGSAGYGSWRPVTAIGVVAQKL